MAYPWEADRSLSEAHTAELIAAQFPEFAPVHLKPLGVGWDNTAWLVNQDYVFRFPRRQMGADCLAAEVAVLPQIVDRLPLPISCPTRIGRPCGDYPWLFAGYPLLKGTSACDALLTIEQRIQLARPLAEFLRTLHAISADAALRLGASTDSLSRLDVPQREAKTRTRLQQAVDRGLVRDPNPFHQIIQAALAADAGTGTLGNDPAPDPTTDVLLHGDLYSLHLLLDEQRRLTGVIDWGDVHIGNRAVDLMVALALLPPAARRIFFDVYGEVDDQTLCLARFRTLYHSLEVVLYADQTERTALRREAGLALEFLTDG